MLRLLFLSQCSTNSLPLYRSHKPTDLFIGFIVLHYNTNTALIELI